MKVIEHAMDKTPHLCLFALSDITAGTEVVYDYGVQDLPFKDAEEDGDMVSEL